MIKVRIPHKQLFCLQKYIYNYIKHNATTLIIITATCIVFLNLIFILLRSSDIGSIKTIYKDNNLHGEENNKKHEKCHWKHQLRYIVHTLGTVQVWFLFRCGFLCKHTASGLKALLFYSLLYYFQIAKKHV